MTILLLENNIQYGTEQFTGSFSSKFINILIQIIFFGQFGFNE